MNETVRALQREHEEKWARANELLSKAEPTDAEMTEGTKLIGEVKECKRKLDQQFNLDSQRDELKTLGGDLRTADPADVRAKQFMFSGNVRGGEGSYLGMSDAGRMVVDSFGSVIDDVGPGTFNEKRWAALQSRDYKRGFMGFIRSKGNLHALGGSQFKAIQEGLDDQGGVLVPADMLMRIIAREPAPTQLAGLVTTITTGRDRVVMPRTQYNADDLYVTAFRATWTGEIPASSSTEDVNDAALLGNLEIPVYTAMLSASLTNDMVEDSAFPIQQWIENQLRITVDLLYENMILNGTGKGQPTGLLNTIATANSSQYVQQVLSTIAGSFGPDDLRELPYAIAPQYDRDARWVLNKQNTGKLIAGFKDSTGRYLFAMGWQDSGLSPGPNKEIGGVPYVYSNFMPNVGASNYPVLYGDLKGYYRAQRLGVTVQILRETKAKLNQFEIVMRVRFGGQPVEPWRMRVLKSNNA
jgi:HK97 family phage major capsid protein